MNGPLVVRWVLQSLKATLAATVVVCILAFSGQASYEAAIEQWTEEKLAAARKHRQLSTAQIWSQRCERRGMDSLAVRADDGPWQIRCVRRQVLQVPSTAQAEGRL